MTEDGPAPGFLKTWLIAVRPFAYTASVLAVLLGASISYYAGHPLRWVDLAVTLFGVVFFHTAANLLNDCYDYRRGLDTEMHPMSGAIVRGLLTVRQVFTAAMIFLVLGIACGGYLCFVAGRVVLILGVIGTLIALTYTTATFCLKFAGLGDAGIFLAFGVLPVFGTFWVQARSFSLTPLLWSVPLALFTVAILHANNWRDIESDPGKGCRTPAALLGDMGSSIYYRLLVLGPFALLLLLFAVGLHPAAALACPVSVLAGLIAVPLSLRLVRISGLRHSETDSGPFLSLDGETAKVHMVFGLLVTVGFFVGRHLPALG